MRIPGLVLLLLCTSIASFAQSAPKGVEVTDIDKTVAPCVDFYQYANGKWRADNPIPASMTRWSRRWSAGEQTKDRLREILDEISKRKDWPTGSVEQVIGDHYCACMDEARVNTLGAAPLMPWFADVDKMKNPADVQAMIARLHAYGVAVPFALGGNSDSQEPNNVIAYVYATGLGLPDRDYYVKQEPRFKEAREKYLAHVTTMFKLAGSDEAKAKAAAATVMRFETALAEHSLDNVALRDPRATDHKMAWAEVKKITPSFDWDAYFKAAKLQPQDVNVTQPEFFAEFDRQLSKTPIDDWKTYLKWHVLHNGADLLSAAFERENFEFYGRYLGGATEMKPRWKRCVESTDGLLGEALGKKYTDKYFPPEAKARMLEMVKNLQWAMGDSIQKLDWMGPETKKRAMEKLATFNPKIGYPDKWTDYSSITIERANYWENVLRASRFAVADNWGTIASPSIAGAGA